MNTGAGGVAFGIADDLADDADQEVQAGDAASLEEALLSTRADELQALQLASRVADRHDQCALVYAQRIEPRQRQCAPDVKAPRLPALAVAPVFKAARRNAVQMEQVSRIALAILARGIATVNAAVGDDLCGWNDVARGPSGTGLGKTPSLMY